MPKAEYEHNEDDIVDEQEYWQIIKEKPGYVHLQFGQHNFITYFCVVFSIFSSKQSLSIVNFMCRYKSMPKPLNADLEEIEKLEESSTRSRSISGRFEKSEERSLEIVTMKQPDEMYIKEAEHGFENIVVPNYKSAYATNTTVASIYLGDGEIEENVMDDQCDFSYKFNKMPHVLQ